jgi:cytochrome c5
MRSTLCLCAAIVPLLFASGGKAQSDAQQAPVPPAITKPSARTHVPQDRGQRIFEANCSRCHNAPESLNPRITGTIVRHMRVRANLSSADERDILHFLNP